MNHGPPGRRAPCAYGCPAKGCPRGDWRRREPTNGFMRVLVVEDEKKTASFIRRALQAEGFAVDVLERGEDVMPAVEHVAFDVVVLDVMLPGRDGLSVLRQMRERSLSTPVLLLTARGTVNERVEGLNLGADDYLSKPFALAELIARVSGRSHAPR